MRPRKSKDLSETGARDAALRALSRREHSAVELKHKLKRRGHSDEAAAAAVERLAENGWQSDTRYAEMLVRSRVQQGYGPLRIAAELSAVGVPDAEAAAVLAQAECDWAQLAAEVRARKFKVMPTGAAEWQKQYRYLAGRGFEPDQIYAALKGEPG